MTDAEIEREIDKAYLEIGRLEKRISELYKLLGLQNPNILIKPRPDQAGGGR